MSTSQGASFILHGELSDPRTRRQQTLQEHAQLLSRRRVPHHNIDNVPHSPVHNSKRNLDYNLVKPRNASRTVHKESIPLVRCSTGSFRANQSDRRECVTRADSGIEQDLPPPVGIAAQHDHIELPDEAEKQTQKMEFSNRVSECSESDVLISNNRRGLSWTGNNSGVSISIQARTGFSYSIGN